MPEPDLDLGVEEGKDFEDAGPFLNWYRRNFSTLSSGETSDGTTGDDLVDHTLDTQHKHTQCSTSNMVDSVTTEICVTTTE